MDPLATALSGRYRIERELGRGGMATVYLAHDLRQDRPVALKVLRPEIASAVGADRFLREIRLTARLDHPNILALLDSGEADGQFYYVMPYVEGESLRDRLQREKQLPLEDALLIARQVAGALTCAHHLGIVHRDIKPENILLAAGHARVADFGIARAATVAGAEPLTQTGMAIGTPTYMSPEQAGGETSVDDRSDIYSLACVTYEMLAGEAPYTGPNPQSILARKLQGPVPSFRLVRAAVPPGVEAAIAKALAVTPADRYSTALEFAEAVERGTTVPGPESASRRVRYPDRRRVLGIVGSAVVVALALAAAWLFWHRPRSGSATIQSLAVLPLENLTGDPEQAYFVDGMHEALTAELAQISALKVISRTSAMRYRGVTRSAPAIGRELGVEGLIEGSVARDGNQVRITVQLIHAQSDRHVWARQFDRELRGILELHTEVARAIADEVQATITPADQGRLAEARPVDPQAFERYLLGRYQLNQRRLEQVNQAIESFRSALDKDPLYAPAHAALAHAHLWVAEQGGMPQQEGCAMAAAAIEQALRLDQSLADAHIAQGQWQANCRWDWGAAERAFKRAIDLSPGSAAAHQSYGRALSRTTDRFEQASAELQRARELDPLSPVVRTYVAQHHVFAGHYDLAGEQLREALELDPNHALLLHSLGELSLAQGRWIEAIGYLERSLEGQSEQSSHYLAVLGSALARAGRREDALGILNELGVRLERGLVSAFDLAHLHLALGSEREALDWLERGYAGKDLWFPELLAWPWFDSLRSHPRYQALVRRMKLPW
jgi:serine/threonine-protein kinase